jgi:hypothetical protein
MRDHDMDLFPHERRRLDDIDGYLGGQEPGLATMFDIFTRLTREDGKPPAERQFLAAGAWRAGAVACHRARRRRLLILAALAAALIAVLITATFC